MAKLLYMISCVLLYECHVHSLVLQTPVEISQVPAVPGEINM